MLLYVYDKSITLIGVIEKITSLVWTEKKYTCGTFAMLLPATPENVALACTERLIMRDEDRTDAGEILYVNIKTGVDGGEELEVTGKFLSNWLNDRLNLYSYVSSTGTPQELMRLIVSKNAIDSLEARNLPLLELGTAIYSREQEIISFKGEDRMTVLVTLESLAEAHDTGFHIIIDLENKRFEFNTYTGSDRTIHSNNPCIFAKEFENILEQQYTHSIENVKNVAYIYGDEQSNVLKPISLGTAEGFERKEVYVNAEYLKQNFLSDNDYNIALAKNGELTLEKYVPALNFYNRVNPESGYRYGIDYHLGDKVTCLNSDWGIEVDTVITEVQTTYENGQRAIYLTFGIALPSLMDKIKIIKR